MVMIVSDLLSRAQRLSAGASAGIAVFLILTACSGGGGGVGGAGLSLNPVVNYLDPASEPTSPFVSDDWSGSQEYDNSTGLAQLKAAEGYARRSGGRPGGQGVRIAIIDSGIDASHPDLGNLSGTSWSAGGEDLVNDDHATFVAGIAAATRTQSDNPDDMHGMAYRATLVNIQASRPSETAANGFVSFSTGDLVDAVRAASGLANGTSAVESDILNLSLGAFANSDSTFASLRNAMRDAADDGKIMVIAAGNQGLDEPIYPAAYADDDEIAGHAIVVGNLTSSNEAASSSNLCGNTRDYCLFAPGTNVQSTLSDGAYGSGSGTSFAAPYVAGAAAVVKAAFPGISSQDVVDRLLLTASDLGDPGVDDTYGRGLLDLETAMAPVGPTGFPIGRTVRGATIPVEPSALRLGRGMVLSAGAKALLGRAMAVDEMGFPFPVDLAQDVEASRRDLRLSSFIDDGGRSVAAAGPAEATISAFVSETDLARQSDAFSLTSFARRTEDEGVVPLSFAAEVTDRATVFASLEGSGGPRFGLAAGLLERRGTVLQTRDLLSPYHGLASASSGGGLAFSPADGTEIAVSAFTSTAEPDEPQRSLQQIEVMQDVGDGAAFRIGLGFIQEEGQFAGGSTRGVFGDESSARSRFLTLSWLGSLTGDIDWFTTYSRGRSSIGSSEGALIGNWSDAQSEAFGAGLVIRDLAREADGLTLSVGQPLRQMRARATIALPVARKPDGSVVTAKERVDFAPKAREITTEIGYRMPLDDGDDHDIRAAGFLRIHPDHDRTRDPEAGFGLAYHWRF